jgi:hypothetical protein
MDWSNSCAPGFHIPTSQCSIETQPTRPNKAKSHRKRHPPPGPAGVWFQAKQQSDSKDQEEGDLLFKNHHSRLKEALPPPDVTIHPAWMIMQMQLPLLTPYLPPYASILERYEVIRALIPSNYMLLPDLDHVPVGVVDNNQSLLALVNAIHINASCDCTVELLDETGTKVNAWMAPSSMSRRGNESDPVRIGVVWKLQQFSIMPSTNSRLLNNENRWLLVEISNIVQYWMPPRESCDEVYLKWMEKRHAIPNNFLSHRNKCTEHKEEDDFEEEEAEFLLEDTTSRKAQLDERNNDFSTLTADFGLQMVPTLHPEHKMVFSNKNLTGETLQGEVVDNHYENKTGGRNPLTCISQAQANVPLSEFHSSGTTKCMSNDQLWHSSKEATSSPSNHASHDLTDSTISHVTKGFHEKNSQSKARGTIEQVHAEVAPREKMYNDNTFDVPSQNDLIGHAESKGLSSLINQGNRQSSQEETSFQASVLFSGKVSHTATTAGEIRIPSNPLVTKTRGKPNPLAVFAATSATTKRKFTMESNVEMNTQRLKGNQSQNLTTDVSEEKITSTGSWLLKAPTSIMSMLDDDDDDTNDESKIPKLQESAQSISLQHQSTTPPKVKSIFHSSNIGNMMKMFDDIDDDD